MTNIYLETYGCTLNHSDSEVMAGILSESGFKIVYSLDEADLVIINSCIVKGPTQNKIIHRVKEIKEHKKVILAGCMPQAFPDQLKMVSKIGTYQLNSIVDVVNATLAGHVVTLIAEDDNERLNLPLIRSNSLVGIIPIARGCLGNCAFCITKKARGNLKSYSEESIIRQAKSLISSGVKELWLTAQDCGAYGKDIGSNLPALLNLLTKLDGDFMIRIGMMNPNNVKDFLEELIEVYMDKKVFRFIHLPVQSGSNSVLKKMNRKYTVEEFKNIVNTLRQNISNLTIATDVICGFPTETKEEFSETVELVSSLKFDIVNISRYWRRPKTKAVELKQLHPSIIKKRSAYLTTVFDRTLVDKNRDWLNWRGKILITEKGTLDNSWSGKNFAYKHIIVLSEENLLGKEIEVKVIDIGRHDLRAKIVSSE